MAAKKKLQAKGLDVTVEKIENYHERGITVDVVKVGDTIVGYVRDSVQCPGAVTLLGRYESVRYRGTKQVVA